MNDEQIQQLKDAIDDGNFQVYWIPDDSTAKKIIRIGNAPTPEEGDEPEPSEVAYTPDGKYIALYNVDMDEFFMVQPLSDLFE